MPPGGTDLLFFHFLEQVSADEEVLGLPAGRRNVCWTVLLVTPPPLGGSSANSFCGLFLVSLGCLNKRPGLGLDGAVTYDRCSFAAF